MDENQWLAEQFEAERPHLRAVAYRMLGDLPEAEDAVQESWLHLVRSDRSSVENMGGWLTTVTARICLDMLRSRKARREESLDASVPGAQASQQDRIDPEDEVLLADSVGLALLVVLDTLSPAERLAFVLHDIFAMPFDEIARIVERSEPTTRKLASRARQRVRGGSRVTDTNVTLQREVVNAFLSATREGNFEALLTLLDPDVVVRGYGREVRGKAVVAKQAILRGFARFAKSSQPILVNGFAGIVVAPHGKLHSILTFTTSHGKITEIKGITDPGELSQLELSVMDPEGSPNS